MLIITWFCKGCGELWDAPKVYRTRARCQECGMSGVDYEAYIARRSLTAEARPSMQRERDRRLGLLRTTPESARVSQRLKDACADPVLSAPYSVDNWFMDHSPRTAREEWGVVEIFQ